MATVRKRGNSYQIRVSLGYRSGGKQITKTMTYKPLPNMTPRQIEKELKRQTVLFEEQCKNGTILDGSIKLSDFAEKWFSDYAQKQLKAKTVARYKDLMKRINQALGYMRLDRLQPHHLIEFYKDLEENAVRADIKYAPPKNFRQILKDKRLTQKELSRLSGVSLQTVRSCVSGRNISKTSADKISAALSDKFLFLQVTENTSLSPKTIQYHHRLLSSMLSTAVEWQLIMSNPCSRVRPPKAPSKEAKYLDENQVTELIRCLENEPLQYKTIIMLLLYSGMRRGELCGLNWEDIDFDENLVNISKASLYLSGVGIYEDTTKNKSSERVIRIPDDMTELLQKHRACQLKHKLACGSYWHDSGKVFTTKDGKPIHPDSITRWFHKFVEKNDLPDVHIHSLRHTNATLLIAAGTNLRTVSNRLGHAAMSTTSNIYAHAIKSADQIAAEKLSDILNLSSKASIK